MARRDEYRNHLKSPEWRDQRNVALARTSGFCQFCGDFAAQVHHVQYPKQFGDEHPDSLIPVCDRCHKTSHGIPEMKVLTNVQVMRDFSPEGDRLNYLVSEGRVYASAKSWIRALQVPASMVAWFESRLAVNALYKKGSTGDELQRSYESTPVYRWRVVAQSLRNFDHAFRDHGFKKRSLEERREREKFHERYERLVEWGDDLQERAIAKALRRQQGSTVTSAPVSEANLVAVVKEAVAPRLRAHDDKLREHDIVIAEIKEAVPAMQDENEFISVKQAISEKGLDASLVPLYGQSNETLSGLTGQILRSKGAEQGRSVIARLDGQSMATAMNTYRRREIYAVLTEIMQKKPRGLAF